MAILLLTGWGHRTLVARIEVALDRVAATKQPLSGLPLRVEGWHGVENEIDKDILERVAWFDDDHVNRTYRHVPSQSTVGVFVGYVGRPRSQLGHRPDVCYAAHGWRQTGQVSLEITDEAGRPVPCLLYEFRHPDGFRRPLRVLATYMINGRFFEDPDDVTGWHGRSPGLLGERPAYLARMQLSKPAGPDRDADVAALQDLLGKLTGPTVGLMPYWERD